jgi:hypothetical protein
VNGHKSEAHSEKREMTEPAFTNMRVVTAATLSLIMFSGASTSCAADFDCGLKPSLACVGAHLFAVARLPLVDKFKHVRASFADSRLMPGNVVVAVEFFVDDNPDPTPWEDIHWLARAGLFDNAMAQAKRAKSPEVRIGGMLAVAWHLAHAKAPSRAAKILAEVELLLPSVTDSEYSHARYAAEVWAQIGRFDRVARLLADGQARSAVALLEIAAKYPANARALRRQAWTQAERSNDNFVWQLITEDAAKRGDVKTTSRAAQQALATSTGDDVLRRVKVIEALLQVNLRDQAAKAIDQWPNWAADVRGPDLPNLILAITPILINLGRDSEVVAAANRITGYSSKSRAFSEAAEPLFRAGRRTEAEKFEAMAAAVAESTPYNDKQSRWERDSAFHNLALARSGRGDIRGALEMASRVGDGTRMRDVVSNIVRVALDSGYGTAAVPAIDLLAALARANGSVNLLIKAASATNRLDQKDKARDMLAEAVALGRRGADPSPNLFFVAELTWRIDGNLDAALALINTSATEPLRSVAFREFVRLTAPSSPATALKIAGRISAPNYQIEALSYVAKAVLAADRKSGSN